MRIATLLIPLILSGCTLSEIKEVKKNSLSLFQKKVEMEKGVYKGILIRKKPLGDKFICYYNYGDYTDDVVSGMSQVKETCPLTVTTIRE